MPSASEFGIPHSWMLLKPTSECRGKDVQCKNLMPSHPSRIRLTQDHGPVTLPEAGKMVSFILKLEDHNKHFVSEVMLTFILRTAKILKPYIL